MTSFSYFIILFCLCSEWSPRSGAMLAERSVAVLDHQASIMVFMARILFVLFEPRLWYSRLTLDLLCCGDFCSSSVSSYWAYRRTLNPSLCGAEEPIQGCMQSRLIPPTHPQFSCLFPEESDCCKPGAPAVFTVTKDMVSLGEMCHQKASS